MPDVLPPPARGFIFFNGRKPIHKAKKKHPCQLRIEPLESRLTPSIDQGYSLAAPGDQTNYDGDAVSVQVASHVAYGGITGLSASGLPSGLTLNDGIVSGTIASDADTHSPYTDVTISGTDSDDNPVSETFQWTVNPLGNQAPVINSVTLDKDSPYTNDTITATVDPSDGDDDTLTYTYTWFVNGSLVQTTPNTSSVTDALDLSQPGNGDKGDTIYVSVTANDGTDDSDARSSENATVANSAPTASDMGYVILHDQTLSVAADGKEKGVRTLSGPACVADRASAECSPGPASLPRPQWPSHSGKHCSLESQEQAKKGPDTFFFRVGNSQPRCAIIWFGFCGRQSQSSGFNRGVEMLTLTLAFSLFSAVGGSAGVGHAFQNGEPRKREEAGGLTSLAVSKDRDFLATCSERGVLAIRDKLGRVLASYAIDDVQQVYLAAVVFDPNDSERVLYATATGLFAWEWKRQAGPHVLLADRTILDEAIRDIAISPNGRAIAMIDANQRVLVIDAGREPMENRAIKTSQKSQNLSVPERRSKYYGALAFSPDSSTIAQATRTDITLYSLTSGKELRRLKAHSGVVGALCFLNEETLLSASWDKSCRIWNIKSGTSRLVPVTANPEACPVLARSHDGKRFACAYDDLVVVYSFPELKEIKRFRGPKSGLTGIAFMRDARFLVTTGESPRLQFWDIGKGREVGKK